MIGTGRILNVSPRWKVSCFGAQGSVKTANSYELYKLRNFRVAASRAGIGPTAREIGWGVKSGSGHGVWRLLPLPPFGPLPPAPSAPIPGPAPDSLLSLIAKPPHTRLGLPLLHCASSRPPVLQTHCMVQASCAACMLEMAESQRQTATSSSGCIFAGQKERGPKSWHQRRDAT